MHRTRHHFVLVWSLAIAVSLSYQPLVTAQSPDKAVSYDDVKKLSQSGLDEAIILSFLEKSPTTFTLSAEQEQELRSLKVSEKVIAALKGNRSGGTPVRELNDLAIVLDCSGSMAEQTSDGQVKMDVAKQVVTDLIERIPDSLHVTFIVYGHDKVNACRKVKVARPLSPLGSSGKSELKSFISQLQPVSKTPIALSLDTARQELAKRDAKCGLILISDGKETCGGDPQGEARKLVEQLSCTFGINVVAFDVDEEGTQQLREVAGEDGRFYEASNTAELQKAIGGLVKEVEQSAEDPAVVHTKSLVTAIEVKPWNIKGIPNLRQVRVYRQGVPGPNALGKNGLIQTIDDFSQSVPLESGTFDLWYETKETNYWVKLGRFEVPAMTKVTINAKRYMSAIKVSQPELEGLSKLEKLWVCTANKTLPLAPSNWTQSAEQYGAPLLVSPSVPYDVYLKLEGSAAVRLARNIKLKGGEVHVIGE